MGGGEKWLPVSANIAALSDGGMGEGRGCIPAGFEWTAARPAEADFSFSFSFVLTVLPEFHALPAVVPISPVSLCIFRKRSTSVVPYHRYYGRRY